MTKRVKKEVTNITAVTLENPKWSNLRKLSLKVAAAGLIVLMSISAAAGCIEMLIADGGGAELRCKLVKMSTETCYYHCNCYWGDCSALKKQFDLNPV